MGDSKDIGFNDEKRGGYLQHSAEVNLLVSSVQRVSYESETMSKTQAMSQTE